MRPLPLTPPLIFRKESRKASWDGHVQVDGNMKPLGRYELLRHKGVTLPHPEHEALAKVVFNHTFPDLGPDFIRLAESCHSFNAAYHLDEILDLLSVYDQPAVAAALHALAETTETAGAGHISLDGRHSSGPQKTALQLHGRR